MPLLSVRPPPADRFRVEEKKILPGLFAEPGRGEALLFICPDGVLPEKVSIVVARINRCIRFHFALSEAAPSI